LIYKYQFLISVNVQSFKSRSEVYIDNRIIRRQTCNSWSVKSRTGQLMNWTFCKLYKSRTANF